MHGFLHVADVHVYVLVSVLLSQDQLSIRGDWDLFSDDLIILDF